MLPDHFTNQTYWQEIYAQPYPYWQSSLATINRRHFREDVGWSRASLGRNIVFISDNWVLKLSPPGWVEDIPRESAALEWVAGRLPVQTPELAHTGWLDRWGYTIQRRLTGQNLHELWKTLAQNQRERIAFQHGEILSALHALPLPDHPARAALSFDWTTLLTDQRDTCAQTMRVSGVDPSLVDQVESYLSAQAAALQNETRAVLLHGDLTHLNFLVEPAGPDWRITGLIDWGDAKIGPPGHELISPGVHMYLGDRAALSAFYQACGPALTAVRYPLELMVRAMLYYAEDFPSFFQRDPELNQCQDWESICQRMW